MLARSDTSLLVDMPGITLVDGKHRAVVLRYLFMVHPQEGRLEAVLWRLDPDAEGNYHLADVPAVRRFLGRVERCGLHVDASEVIAGIPSPSVCHDLSPLGRFVAVAHGASQDRRPAARDGRDGEQIDLEIRRAIGFLPASRHTAG